MEREPFQLAEEAAKSARNQLADRRYERWAFQELPGGPPNSASAAGPERLAVARDDDVGNGQDPFALLFEQGLIRREGIDRRRPIGKPPQVRQRVDAVFRLDDERGIFLGMAGRQPQLRSRCHPPAISVMVEPEVVAVASPEVDDLGVREQGDVDRVIRVVMAEEHVGDRLRGDTQVGERVEDEPAVCDETGIRDDQRVPVPDERDAAADVTALANVARVDEVDARHSSRW
jgi:hypothetical protein